MYRARLRVNDLRQLAYYCIVDNSKQKIIVTVYFRFCCFQTNHFIDVFFAFYWTLLILQKKNKLQCAFPYLYLCDNFTAEKKKHNELIEKRKRNKKIQHEIRILSRNCNEMN